MKTTVLIEFPKEKKATKCISTNRKINEIIIRDLKTPIDFGETPDNDNINHDQEIILSFNKVKSIDVLIEALKIIKDNIENPEPLYPLAS